MKKEIYTIADGNATAIVGDGDIPRSKYEEINNKIQESSKIIEQVGFFELDQNGPRLQMAGGEFCGNASRAFACFLKKQNPKKEMFSYRVSGFEGIVKTKVREFSVGKYYCESSFKNFPYQVYEKFYEEGRIKQVDLSGITHVIFSEEENSFPAGDFKEAVQKIKNALNLDREAIGFTWFSEKKGKISIKPIVWVKAIDTCFYETACGSATIALGIVLNRDIRVFQPSGGVIDFKRKKTNISIASEVKELKN